MKAMVFVLSAAFLFSTCVSVDVERQKIREIKAENRKLGQNVPARYIRAEAREEEAAREAAHNTNVITVREPVYVPVDAVTGEPPKKAADAEILKKSLNEALVSPGNFIGGTQFYDYNEHKQYLVICKILGLTVIQLQDGEEPIGSPYLSDSMRWEIAGDVWATSLGKQVQLIMLKPYETGLSTNMVVVTNRRIYQFLLKSTGDSYMPMVRFRYPFEQGYFVTARSLAEEKQRTLLERDSAAGPGGDEFLAYNYSIQAGFLGWMGLFGWNWGAPEWTPLEIWDDGHKTYIRLPRSVLQKEYPVVFEKRRYIVNYRVQGDLIILDKIAADMTLVLGKKRVRIIKRKGIPEDIRRYEKKPVEVLDENPAAPARFDISGDTAWAPARVMENGNETIMIWDEDFFSKEPLLIIDEDNEPVEYRKQANVITIPHTIRQIRIAFAGESIVIKRR